MLTKTLFILFVFFHFTVLASEQAQKPPAEPSAHESKEDKSQAADSIKSVKNQIAVLESDIADLKSRSQLSQTLINQLLAKKQTLPDKSPEIKLIITQVNEEYVKLKSMSNKLNEKLNELRYKYPERAGAENSSGKVKEVKQMEEDVIFANKLKKTVEHIKKQYGYKSSPAKKNQKTDFNTEKKSQEENENDLFEKPVIIDK